ncbi:U4/U6.U5 tri-snRNP-associated protein 2 [Pyrenochaeta sp. DS3sAY3a]|nr:U4/U6.U5 tri-snRNP-associated protein 2 [Pyrenochaeta sp. DS3sAY3a]
MAKRRASGPLENTLDAPSLAPKRARVDSEDMESPQPDTTLSAYAQRDADDNMVTSDGDDDDDNEPAIAAPMRLSAPDAGYTDLYLDTIDRKVLDFDFEKLCSVTLSNINVYACLVCGKYYQGRGPKSQAYFHALEEGHHVYVNMETKKVYVLPEGYEVMSKSLDDLKFVVDPRLSKTEVAKLDKEPKVSWDLSNREYIPGFVGMNNIKANDYFNVVIQALSHVVPLRNYFMLEDLSARPQLAQRFSTLVRKIWNPRAFKTHVSPHELLQEIALRSSKRFSLTEQSDPVEFLSWFLNHLHLAVGGSKTKPNSSIIQKVFQGSLKIESQEITARADTGDRLRFEDAAVTTDISKYLVLTLDLPAAPLFQDALEKNIIPQVPLVNILTKYNGVTPQEKSKKRVRYRLLHPLPPYLLFNIKRFSVNKFVSERNPTIVTFPVRSLDMAPYVEPNPSQYPPGEPIWYDLVANITHEAVRKRDDSVEGEQESKVWRVQVKDRARDEWYGIQDLFVEKVSGETLFTKEAYLMVWERRKGQVGVQGKGK